MPAICLHICAYGRPAAELLRARVAAAKAGDPLEPVTVVVPTNYVGVSMRRRLAEPDGIVGLNLLTVYRLAELLGAPRLATSGRRPVSTLVIAAAVRRVLADDPGIFGPVREHPSTEEALVRSHRELSEVTAASLDRLAAASVRAAEVVRVHRAVHALLADRWYEESDLMVAAGDSLAAGAPVLADLGTVVVYLPQDLSLPAAALLRAVADATAMEVIAGRTGEPPADADVDRCLRRLGLEPPEHAPLEIVRATEVVSVSDAEEEVRSAVQRVIDAARSENLALERMAMLYPSPEPYARIVHEQLAGAGIPCNGAAVRPLSDRLLGRWLLDLLALPDEGYSRPALMGLLAAAPDRASGTWERISRDAGIVGGAGEWRGKLERFAAEQRQLAEIEASGDDPRGWLVERRRRNADQAGKLQEVVSGLLGELRAAAGLGTWTELAAWCRRMAERHLGGGARRERWPEDERAAADRVDEALDRLAGLDEVHPEADLRVFRRTLELELDDDLGRVGEFGQGVLVGTPTAALGVDLDLVVVLGLAEGVMPTRLREDSLLPDSERGLVAEELRPRAERVGVEHRHLLTALAAAAHHRVLSYPRGDLRRSMERAPSRFLLDCVAHLRGDGVRELPASAAWLTVVASYAQRVRTTGFPATRQLYGLRALEERAARLVEHPLVAGDAVLRAGAELVLARRSDDFTRFDGNLSGLAAHIGSPADVDRAISPSQLEAWLACPHAHLMEYVLGVQPVELPEELLEITPLEKGLLVHGVLERWLVELLGGPLPRPDQPWPGSARELMGKLAEQACDAAGERGATGHPLLWRRDRRRLLADLTRFVDADDARRAKLGAKPVAAERAFGLPGSGTDPVTVALPDGRTVRLRGRIDRVDETGDGTTVVADYKTGADWGYTGLTEDAPLGDGTRLQLAIYGLAVGAGDPDASVRAEYWFTSAKGGFRRRGYPVTAAVVDHLREAVRVAVDGIGGGLFPMKPPAPGWRRFTECRYCDPDELGTADRHRDWERVRRAAELRDYVGFVEPEALEEVVQT